MNINVFRYIFAQSIGIYYKDFDWAMDVYESIIDHLPKEYFVECRKNKYGLRIVLMDGSTIRFVRVGESSKGCCFSKIIMQPGIDKEIIESIICPTLKHSNRRIMILEDDCIDYI